MKKLLYIGHAYHNKTKSTQFLQDLFKTVYTVETFDFDPYNDTYDIFNKLEGKTFDVVVIFQIAPNIDKLKQLINCQKFVFFPMYDGSGNASDEFWYSYRNVKIINFSKTLHNRLISKGLDSHYIQFFPKPAEKIVKGNTKFIFFWQRINNININLVAKLFSKTKIDKIHIHKAIDPQHSFIEPNGKMPFDIEYSEWYENKSDMLKDIEEAQIYIAPRIYEGIGMSFLEAMAMGRCVVAPNLPTMNEYIEQGQNGVLYDINKIEPLDNFDAIKLGKNAFNYINQGYKKWEKEKNNILQWVIEPLNINKKLLKKLKCRQHKTVTYKLFGFLPILKIKYKNSEIKIHILGRVPLLTINNKEILK